MRGFLERRKRLVLLLVVVFVGGILFLSYFCPNSLCSTVSDDIRPRIITLPSLRTEPHSQELSPPRSMLELDLPPVNAEFSDEEVERTFSFNADHDVLVFLHAQKTGGSTFGRHLVRDTVGAGVPSPCVCQRRRKRCDCGDSRGRQWLFSRYRRC